MHDAVLLNEPKSISENGDDKTEGQQKPENPPATINIPCEEANETKNDEEIKETQALEEKEESHVTKTPDTQPIAEEPETDGMRMETEPTDTPDNPPVLTYNFTKLPQLLCTATKEYQFTEQYENFTKGCQWSPDGTCLLVPSEDFRIRMYELPRELYSGKLPSDWSVKELPPVLTIKEGGLVYDCCWYPTMNSWVPETCCFLSTSRESPAHLWDAFTGKLRATYRAYNQVDEVEASLSVQFVNSGQEVWCGFKNALRIFDTERPGRQTKTIEFKKQFPNTSGLVSCIRENPTMPGLVAFGTYSKCIGLFKDSPLCTFKVGNGVTQIEFSPCGMKMFSAVRRSDEFICWDLRNPGVKLYSLQGRQSDTNQRVQFSLSHSGKHIISGGTDGSVAVWELPDETVYEEDLHPIGKMQLSSDCINGVSLHKSLPVIATSSGQRLCEEEAARRNNGVSLWWSC